MAGGKAAADKFVTARLNFGGPGVKLSSSTEVIEIAKSKVNWIGRSTTHEMTAWMTSLLSAHPVVNVRLPGSYDDPRFRLIRPRSTAFAGAKFPTVGKDNGNA